MPTRKVGRRSATPRRGGRSRSSCQTQWIVRRRLGVKEIPVISAEMPGKRHHPSHSCSGACQFRYSSWSIGGVSRHRPVLGCPLGSAGRRRRGPIEDAHALPVPRPGPRSDGRPAAADRPRRRNRRQGCVGGHRRRAGRPLPRPACRPRSRATSAPTPCWTGSAGGTAPPSCRWRPVRSRPGTPSS